MEHPTKHSQSGAALLTGLILLTILMLGAMSMLNTSSLNERMTGNHKASANAFHAAEAGLFAAINEMNQSSSWSGLRSSCAPNEEITAIGNTFDTSQTSSYKLSYHHCGTETIGIRSEGVVGARALRNIVFDVRNGVPSIEPPAAISCLGGPCDIKPGSASEAPISGQDHPVPAPNCSGNSCRAVPHIGATNAVPAVFLSHKTGSTLASSSNNGNGNGNGNEKMPFVGLDHNNHNNIAEGEDVEANSVWSPGNYPAGSAPSWDAFFGSNSVAHGLHQASTTYNSLTNNLHPISSPGIAFITANSHFSGNAKYSGLTLVDGSTLSMTGTGYYAGLLIITNCGVLDVSGTYTIFGAVIVDATGCTFPYSPFQGNGTLDVKYSKDALATMKDSVIALVIDDWYEIF